MSNDFSSLKPWVQRWPTVALLTALICGPFYFIVAYAMVSIEAFTEWFHDVKLAWAQWKSRYGW